MPRLFCFLMLALVAALPSCSQPPPPDTGNLQMQAAKMIEYFRTRDFDKMVDMMYPKFVEIGGGHGACVRLIKSTLSGIARAGVEVDSVEVGKAEKPVRGGDQWFALVPQTTRMTGPKGKLEQIGYNIAISSDEGKTWSFIGAGAMPPDIKQQLFPNFPSALVIPEERAPRLTPP